MPTPSLAGRTTRGIISLSLGSLLSRVVVVATTLLVLARLLGPVELGLAGLAMVTVVVMETVSQLGLTQALIQRRRTDRSGLGTAMSLQVLRGLLLGSLLLGLAQPISSFYDLPRLAPLLATLSLLPVIQGLRNTGLAILEQGHHFARLSLLDIAVQVLESATTIALACWSAQPDAWAVVVGKLVGASVGTGLSYLITAHRSRLCWDAHACRDLLGFSAWMLLSALLTAALVRGGDLVIGKLLPIATLGCYQLALGLSAVPTAEVSRAIGRALFPSYHALAERMDRLRPAFRRSHGLHLHILALVSASMWLAADPLVDLVLDPRWRETALLIPPLAVWGACRALGSHHNALFMATGHPAWTPLMQVPMLLAVAALIAPAYHAAGSAGIAWSFALAGILGTLLRLLLVRRLLAMSARSLLQQVLEPALALALGIMAHRIATLFIAPTSIAPTLLLLAINGLVYGGTVLLLARLPFTTLNEILGSFRTRRRSREGVEMAP